MWSIPREDHNRLFLAVMAVLVIVAWLVLWDLGPTSARLFHHQHAGGLDAFDSNPSLFLFVAGWSVMVVAMMLPTSLPLITLFRTIVRRRPDRTLLVALLVVGYLALWTLFGILVYFGGWSLHLLVEQSAWLQANPWVLGAGVFLLAGLYQFTPLKHKCLEKCRSPLSFVMQHWRGEREKTRSLRLGAHHGLFCVGCCWSLMLIMFLVGGAGSLDWMLVLGAVMAVEKNVSWGRRLSVPLGVLLLGLGLTFGTASALEAFSDSQERFVLSPAQGSSVNGVATLTDTPGGVEVELDVAGLPQSGTMYLAHIHPGSCAGEQQDDGEHHDPVHHLVDGEHGEAEHHGDHEPGGHIEYPLTPITPGSEGTGSSTTKIGAATLEHLVAGEELYLNVHDEGTLSGELPDSLACGDLGYLEKAIEQDHEAEPTP